MYNPYRVKDGWKHGEILYTVALVLISPLLLMLFLVCILIEMSFNNLPEHKPVARLTLKQPN